MSREDLLREMRLLLSDGRQFGGADAAVALALEIWWARPLVWLGKIPGAMGVMRGWYKSIAEHRHCSALTCDAGQITRRT
jgi:hypothetical protein